jgi:GNAT superfamily N-acetyltransferase
VAGPLRGGAAVLLPFDPAACLLDHRVVVKSFHGRRDRLPSERVSLVSKAELRHVIHRSLEYLHHLRGIPYAHIWWYPADVMNIVALRIDTDGATRDDVDDLYALSRETGIGFTWFVDVKPLTELLPHLASMIGQEFGTHCFEHRHYTTRDDALADLGRAKDVLQHVGLAGEGMAAPYGQWSEALADAQEILGFGYASEFSCAYDTLPYFPARDARPYRVLQVPVHPICPGTLRQAGYTDVDMTAYFADVADAKLLRRDPLLFYHHPSHHARGVMRGLLRHALEAGCRPMTLGTYARWWRKRADVRVAFEVDRGALKTVIDAGAPGDVWIRISEPEGRETFTPPRPLVTFAEQTWTVAPAYRPPQDIRRIREFDPRALLGRIYTSMTRRVR